MSESRCGRPGLPVPNGPYGLCGRKASLNERKAIRTQDLCQKVDVAVLGSPSLMVRTVSVGVRQH